MNIKNHKGTVFVVSAPSGAGKTSLVKALIEKTDDVAVSVSHTTRAKRPGEIDGQDYFFVADGDFKQMINKNEFIEHAKVFDHFYGTSKKAIENIIADGKNVILEIDWQGAHQAKAIFQESCVMIFILPPSLEALRARLSKRAQDTQEVIERRMRDAQSEASHAHEYDYVIINDDFQTALDDLNAVFRVQKLKASLYHWQKAT